MKPVRRFAIGLFLLFLSCASAFADSAIDLLSGFDLARIESAYPPSDDATLGELAKLIYRLQAISGSTLESRVAVDEGSDRSAKHELGDAVTVTGELVRVRKIPVPEALVEFLELRFLFIVDLQSEESGPRKIIAGSFPADAQPGDRISSLGVAIELNAGGSCQAMAASGVEWMPVSTSRAGWRLLGEVGFDVALLSDAKERSRQPLVAEDGDAFYSMMSAARRVAAIENPPTPLRPRAVELLEEPEDLIGQWLALKMETVQITRITVTEPSRQDQLGQDYYYQIDAVVDLGDVVVKIKPPKDSAGEPAIFENRYPVSVVAAEIPPFLDQQIRVQEGGDAVVSQLRTLVGIEGFYFRLWSYESEFMTQRGGGDQFGPLLVATSITDLSETADDPAGVKIIGWIASGGVIVGILFFWIWSRVLAKRDQRAKQLRRQREAEQIQLPGV